MVYHVQLSIPIYFGILVHISSEFISYFSQQVNYISKIIFTELNCICNE